MLYSSLSWNCFHTTVLHRTFELLIKSHLQSCSTVSAAVSQSFPWHFQTFHSLHTPLRSTPPEYFTVVTLAILVVLLQAPYTSFYPPSILNYLSTTSTTFILSTLHLPFTLHITLPCTYKLTLNYSMGVSKSRKKLDSQRTVFLFSLRNCSIFFHIFSIFYMNFLKFFWAVSPSWARAQAVHLQPKFNQLCQLMSAGAWDVQSELRRRSNRREPELPIGGAPSAQSAGHKAPTTHRPLLLKSDR